MSDLDQLDPALDQAFESLTRDLAHAASPGAAAAVSTARRRRRTRVGAVALAALVVVGGALMVPRVPSTEDGVASDGGSARLDAAALGRATEGWISGWADPEDRESSFSGGAFGAASCFSLGAPGGSPAPAPVSTGTTQLVTPDDAVARVVVLRYADAERARSAQELALSAPDTCGSTTMYDVDGVAVRHDSMPPEQPGAWLGDIWSVRIGAERAQVEISTGVGNAGDRAAESVAQAMVAGLRDGWTQSGMESVHAESGSGGTTSVIGPSVTVGQVRASAAGWPSELTGGRRARDVRLPCVRQSAAGESAWSTAHQLGDRATVTMAGEQDATYALDSVDEALASCSSTRWRTRRGGDGLWASSDRGTVVMVAVGTRMAWLEAADVAPPTAEQAAGVQELLRTWIADTKVTSDDTREP